MARTTTRPARRSAAIEESEIVSSAENSTTTTEVNQASPERRLTVPEHAHMVAEMVQKNAIQLSSALITAGKLQQGGAIAAAAEQLIDDIRAAFPNA